MNALKDAIKSGKTVVGTTVTEAAKGDSLGNPNGSAWDAKGNRFILAPFGSTSLQAWAPGQATPTTLAVGPGVPAAFREMVGYGDMVTAALALTALIVLRAWGSRAIWFVWVFVVVGVLDTANAVVQSMRYSVFDDPLGVNWVIVTAYVPALLVSSYLIIVELLRARRAPSSTSRRPIFFITSRNRPSAIAAPGT